MQTLQKPSRNVYLDVARIVAIVLVLMNHLPAYRLYMTESGVGETWSLLFSILVRINVPLFAMISGALLLGRSESVATVFRKRVMRFVIVIVAVSALLYLEFGWLRGRSLSIDDFFYGVVAGNLKDFTSYWFLYAYLGFLLMLPFLRHIAQMMTRGEFCLLLLLMLVLHSGDQLVSFLLRLSGNAPLIVSHSLATPLISVVLLFYPLVGYYIDKHVNVCGITRGQWYLLGCMALACSSLTAAVVWGEGRMFGFTQNYINLLNFVNVIIIFLAIKRVFDSKFMERHPLASRRLSLVSTLVFGIYLFDPFLKLMLYDRLYSALQPSLHDFCFSALWCLVSFTVCGLFTYGLKQLPYINKLI